MKPLPGFLLACAAAALLPPGSPCRAQDAQWLSYRSSEQAALILEETSSTFADLRTEAPDGVQLPTFNTDAPLFARWRTPLTESGGIWFAFDRAGKYGQHNRLYADSDADGSLADEDVIKAGNAHQYGANFPRVKLVLPGADGPVTYHVTLDLHSQPNYRRLTIRAAAWYEGPVRIGDRTWRCRLLDYNVNGVFDDTALDFDQTDRIRIGVDGDWTTYFVGKYVEIDGGLYRPTLARDGAWIAFTSAGDVPQGTIRVASDMTRVSVGGENGLFHIRLRAELGQLPVGTYRLYSWELEREAEDGAAWRATGTGFRNRFEVRADTEVRLDIGEPLIGSLTASKQGSEFRFQQALRGRLDERISITCDDKRPPAPKLRIRSGDGLYDKTFQFEYG